MLKADRCFFSLREAARNEMFLAVVPVQLKISTLTSIVTLSTGIDVAYGKVGIRSAAPAVVSMFSLTVGASREWCAGRAVCCGARCAQCGKIPAHPTPRTVCNTRKRVAKSCRVPRERDQGGRTLPVPSRGGAAGPHRTETGLDGRVLPAHEAGSG